MDGMHQTLRGRRAPPEPVPRPAWRASTMACERSAAPILLRTFETWLRTVFGLRTNRPAMVLLSRPCGDQLQDVQLSAGELSGTGGRRDRSGPGLRQLADRLRQLAVQDDVAGGGGPQRVLDPVRAGPLHQVAARAVAERGEDRLVVLGHREHDHLRRAGGARPASGSPPAPTRRAAARRAARHPARAAVTTAATSSARSASPTSSTPVHVEERGGEPHAEHRVVVDDEDPERRHGRTAGSRTCTPGAVRRVGGERDRAAELRRPARASRPARRPSREPGATPTPSSTTSMSTAAPVSMRSQQLAAAAWRTTFVSASVTIRYVATSTAAGSAGSRRGRSRCSSTASSSERANSRDRPDQAELIECGRTQVADDPLDLDDRGVDLVRQPLEEAERATSASTTCVPLELADRGAQPERDAGERRPEPVVQVAPEPSSLLLARGDDGQARAAQLRGEAHPAHREGQRRGQLVERRGIPRPEGRCVGPADDEPADDLVAMAQRDLLRVGRRRAERGRALPPARARRRRWRRRRGASPVRGWRPAPAAAPRRPPAC